MEVISETVNGDSAKLICFYRNKAKNDSVRLVFKLIKQNGDWKIDSYGFGDPDEAAPTPNSSIPMPPMSDDFVPPPPPEPETARTPKRKR